MNFPIWELHWAGGGLLIALIAVFHVYVAHFAIGGGLFLVLTEHLAYRRNSQPILDYTKRHTKFFLIVTMVLGGISGVGIWFIISLVSPAATTQLIHTFVFAWAIEWVFFLAEIVALFIYFYTFGKMGRRNHLTIGWLYFFFGWMSLFMINGIIGFMLTPGDWLTTKDFWDGFFNPTFWPALAFQDLHRAHSGRPLRICDRHLGKGGPDPRGPGALLRHLAAGPLRLPAPVGLVVRQRPAGGLAGHGHGRQPGNRAIHAGIPVDLGHSLRRRPDHGRAHARCRQAAHGSGPSGHRPTCTWAASRPCARRAADPT
jgi:hypothetical protein